MRHAASVLLLLLTWLVAGCGGGATAALDQPTSPSVAVLPGSEVDPDSGLPWVLEAELPPNAQATLLLIDTGGPFPYDKDGSTFGNREGLLPPAPSGYYAEFTVDKPGEDDRGPWRLVTGSSGEVFWTEDHYSSFSRVWR